MIAIIAVISTVSIGTIYMNGFSAIPLATASVSPESGTMMGHVEYILRDTEGNIKSYGQGDNMVVNRGDDCVMAYTFSPQNAGGTDNCVSNNNGFRYIGIGNATTTIANTDTTLTNTATTIASTGTGGLMAMRTDSSTASAASSDGGIVTIATESPFTFGLSNATTVHTAGLFDVACTASATTGICTAYGTDSNMFSVQRLSGGTGVVVASGDSLSVTWSITVGNSS